MSMREYKVIFDNNRPVTAMQQKYVDYKQLIRLCREGDQRFMKWLVVVAEDEKDAIRSADHILNTYWGKYLGQSIA